MPRFYFDTVMNGEMTYDDAGIELDGLEAARQEAL
jgi:hypothetical protein